MADGRLGQFKLHETAKTLKPKRSYLTGQKKIEAKDRICEFVMGLKGKKTSYEQLRIKTDIPSRSATERLVEELIKEGRLTRHRSQYGVYLYAHSEVRTIQEPKVVKTEDGYAFTEEEQARLDAAAKATVEQIPAPDLFRPNLEKELDAWFIDYANTVPTADYLIGANAFRRHVHRQLSKEGEN